jgi:putative MATE family efflux protein
MSTPGSTREILRLALPAFGALVMQPMLVLIDAAIVGTLGTVPLAALGAGAQVFSLITGLAVFLAYGTTGAVARHVGAGQPEVGLLNGIQALFLAAGLGTLAAALTWVGAPWLVAAIGTSPESRPLAMGYIRVTSLGYPFALVTLAALGVLRGLQDTASTLWVAALGLVANTALCLLLVLGADLGVNGSAWALVLTEALVAGTFVLTIARRCAVLGTRLAPSRAGVFTAARASVPLFLRTAALRAVLLLAIAVAARLGDADLAAYYVTAAVWSLLAYAMDALAIAAQALLGHDLGAGRGSLARERAWQMTGWGVGLGLILGAGVILMRPVLASTFSADPLVQAGIASALIVVGLQQPLAGVVFVLDGVLLGAGDGVYLAWAQVAALIAFIPAAWLVITLYPTVTALWWALVAFMLVRAVAFTARVRGTRWLVTGALR